MIRLSLAYFYRLGATFHSLRSLRAGQKYADAYTGLHEAETAIEQLTSDRTFGSALRGSFAPGRKALEAIREARRTTNWDAELDPYDVYKIQQAANEFEIVLNNELAVADAYYVLEKDGYSTLRLISEGEIIFSRDIAVKVPEAVADLREAAKCIAFELGTAAGFHIMRAMEAVLRSYWTVVSNRQPHPRARNIGIYLRRMEKYGYGDAKVIAALTQFKNLHRNSLIHPEDSLSVDDAIGLVGIAQSAMRAMLKAIPERQADVPPPDAETFPAITIDEAARAFSPVDDADLGMPLENDPNAASRSLGDLLEGALRDLTSEKPPSIEA